MPTKTTTKRKAPSTPKLVTALQLARQDQRRIEGLQRAVDQSARRIQRAQQRLEMRRLETARALLQTDPEYGVYGHEEVRRLITERDGLERQTVELRAELDRLTVGTIAVNG